MIKQQEGFKLGDWKKIDVKPTITSDGFYGMREWQEKAFEVFKSCPHMILNAPMGSGKSWLMCFIAAYKMKHNPSLRCIISVPQTIIASGFAEANLLMPDGEKLYWMAQHNLCNEQPHEGTIKYVINWLEDPFVSLPDRVLICTHATLVGVWKKLKELGKCHLFKDLLVWVDEAHHLKNTLLEEIDAVISNGIGEIVAYLLEQTSIEVGLATASPFRGDKLSLLTPKMQEKFTRFDLPYDEYLGSMKHLKSFSFDFLLCGHDYTKAIEVLAKHRKGKDIVYVPHPISRHSTGDKYAEVENVIAKYKKVRKGRRKDDGVITILNNEFKIIDLVNEKSRKEKKDFIKRINENRNALDAIVTLGMFKEGANWIWADRSIIVGIRNSLVDIVQMIGRLFRDAPEKEHVEVVQLLPFSLDQKDEEGFRDNLNNYLKAVYASLILENIFDPVKIKAPLGGKGEERGERKNWLSEVLPDSAKQVSLIEDISTELMELVNVTGETNLWDNYEKAATKILESYGVSDHIEEVKKEIWAIFARRTARIKGLNVDGIEFEILKKGIPLDFLLRYTSDSCNYKTFADLRKAISINNASENKKKLLEMARNGEPRPEQKKHPLGKSLASYIGKSQSCYDPQFDKQIRILRPDWFIDTVSENKKKLFKMARNGEPRPVSAKHPLGSALGRYTNKNNAFYDAHFSETIKKIAPDWFVSQTEKANKKKEKLLQMAKDGDPKPIYKKNNQNKLGLSLVCYTDKTSHKKTYDPVFDKEIRQLRPDWFIGISDKANKSKLQLLEIAKSGKPRPHHKTNKKLSVRLSWYTCHCYGNYDSEFNEQIRQLRPDWFIGQTEKANENKKKLLEMARNGEPRPRRGSQWRTRLNSYTGKHQSSYDVEFNSQIRQLRPDWFDNPAEKKKTELLELAKNGDPRPHHESPIGIALMTYTTKSWGGSFNAQFNETIRKLRPDWFISQTQKKNLRKQQLIEIAKRGDQKPIIKLHPLGWSLNNYMNKAHKSYDSIFDQEIRKLAPHWFKK